MSELRIKADDKEQNSIVVTQKALCTVANVSLDESTFTFECVDPGSYDRHISKISQSVSASQRNLVVPGAPFYRICGYEVVNGYTKMFIIYDFQPNPPFTKDELKMVKKFWRE